MKKLFLIIFFSFLSHCNLLLAQITLEHVLDSTSFPAFYCTDIGNNDFKYISVNASTNSFNVLNMDMTPYLTNIQIPVTDSINQGFSVTYVTKALFDCDSTNVEYVYQNSNDVNKSFRIIRTDGTMLLQVDSAQGPYNYGGLGGAMEIRPIINTSDGTKLFLQKYDSNHVAEVLIYGLCGTLAARVFEFRQNVGYLKIFPNPTAMELNFEITLPNNQEPFILVIADSNGKVQKRQELLFSKSKYSFDVNQMSSGMYTYSLVSMTRAYQSGSFVVTK